MDDQRFVSSVETLNDRVHRFTIAHRGSDGACGATLRWEEVIELWRTDGAFARFFTMMLAACTHESFFWECPPVSSARTCLYAGYVACSSGSAQPYRFLKIAKV